MSKCNSRRKEGRKEGFFTLPNVVCLKDELEQFGEAFKPLGSFLSNTTQTMKNEEGEVIAGFFYFFSDCFFKRKNYNF